MLNFKKFSFSWLLHLKRSTKSVGWNFEFVIVFVGFIWSMNLIRFLNALHNFMCAFMEGNEPMNSKARSHSQLIRTKTKEHHRLNQHKYVYIYTVASFICFNCWKNTDFWLWVLWFYSLTMNAISCWKQNECILLYSLLSREQVTKKIAVRLVARDWQTALVTTVT